MSKHNNHLVLEVLDKVATEQAPTFLVGKQHIAIVKILELYTLRPVHDIHTYRHNQTILLVSDLLDLANLTLPWGELQDDRVAHRHVAYRLTEEHLQLAALKSGPQLLHLTIRDGHHMTIRIAIMMQMGTGTDIPFGIDDVMNTLFGHLHKNKTSQVVAQLVVSRRAQKLIRNKELVRWQHRGSLLQ